MEEVVYKGKACIEKVLSIQDLLNFTEGVDQGELGLLVDGVQQP